MMTALSAAPLVLVTLFAIGCGASEPAAPRSNDTGGAESAAEPGSNDTGGAESAAEPAPSEPPLSYLNEGARVVVLLDMKRARRWQSAAKFASEIRATPTWQRFSGGSGIDPVQDLDTILVGVDERNDDRHIVVLRHALDEAEVRQRVAATASDRDGVPEWRDVEGLTAITWPVERATVPYSLILTAPHELVLAPDDDLPRIAAVARDHATRRGSVQDAVIEPRLHSARMFEIVVADLGALLSSRDGSPTPPRRASAHADERDDGLAAIEIRAEFATPSEASAARAWLEKLRGELAQQIFIRVTGLYWSLEEATLTVEGAQLAIEAPIKVPHVQILLLGLVKLAQATHEPE
jgi:hypothetical protein